MGRMVRTNIVLDEELVREVMDLYGCPSKREAVHFALRSVLGKKDIVEDPGTAMLELEGIWADMTDEEARAIWDPDAPR
jgi:Arc/MetJ family transcription regulator